MKGTSLLAISTSHILYTIATFKLEWVFEKYILQEQVAWTFKGTQFYLLPYTKENIVGSTAPTLYDGRNIVRAPLYVVVANYNQVDLFITY